MFFNVLKAKDLVGFDNGGFEKNVLMADNDSMLAAIALKKDEIIDTHTSVCDAAVYVLDGEIEIHFAVPVSHKIFIFIPDLKGVSLKFSSPLDRTVSDQISGRIDPALSRNNTLK